MGKKMDNTICNMDRCCGCGACGNVCPKNCISFQANDEGFLYPTIDKDSCINCEVCKKVCPVNSEVSFSDHDFIQHGYAMYTLDEDIRKNSSSGGIFKLCAMEILCRGGVVFGVILEDNCRRAVYAKATNDEELSALLGSKYMQAEVGYIYRAVRAELQSGKDVLFAGVPCQIAALKKYLNRDYENLFTIGLICHGVPSPLLWNKYHNHLQSKRKRFKYIAKTNFRSKKYGWYNYGLHIVWNDGVSFFEPKEYNSYLQMFFSDVCLRKSCYQCKFKGLKQDSDITLGDFWGIHEYDLDMFDNKGTSIVLTHSPKGEILLDKLKSLSFVKCEIIDYVDVFSNHNDAMTHSADMPKNRTAFFEDMDLMTYRKLSKKYVRLSNKIKLKKFLDKVKIKRS
jgi:coenzyme F420-reducing hydrogenase beta subunit